MRWYLNINDSSEWNLNSVSHLDDKEERWGRVKGPVVECDDSGAMRAEQIPYLQEENGNWLQWMNVAFKCLFPVIQIIIIKCIYVEYFKYSSVCLSKVIYQEYPYSVNLTFAELNFLVWYEDVVWSHIYSNSVNVTKRVLCFLPTRSWAWCEKSPMVNESTHPSAVTLCLLSVFLFSDDLRANLSIFDLTNTKIMKSKLCDFQIKLLQLCFSESFPWKVGHRMRTISGFWSCVFSAPLSYTHSLSMCTVIKFKPIKTYSMTKSLQRFFAQVEIK